MVVGTGMKAADLAAGRDTGRDQAEEARDRVNIEKKTWENRVVETGRLDPPCTRAHSRL